MAKKVTRADFISHRDVHAELMKDPEFRAEWERTALARAIAIRVAQYRVEHGLSQRAMARKLGMAQSAASRLESGDHNPSFETLVKLARVLDLELMLDITPGTREAQLVSKRARTGDLVGQYEAGDCKILVATA